MSINIIDSYQFGRIVINGKEYTSDVIISPNTINGNWWRKTGHELCLEDIADITTENPEALVIGTGVKTGVMLAAPTQLPGSIQKLPSVNWFIVSNPTTAISMYQADILGGDSWVNGLGLLISPIVLITLMAVFGPKFLDSRLSLQGGVR